VCVRTCAGSEATCTSGLQAIVTHTLHVQESLLPACCLSSRQLLSGPIRTRPAHAVRAACAALPPVVLVNANGLSNQHDCNQSVHQHPPCTAAKPSTSVAMALRPRQGLDRHSVRLVDTERYRRACACQMGALCCTLIAGLQ
jgi:hypothetical protein